ncbi:MAG: DNA-binding response regulator [Cytophagaceae bacterium]|nr:DNA-binding response regulator [Cytophagaceae bacterium]
MKCLIIDDEEMARAIIAKHCSTVDEIEVVEQFPNAIQAIKYLNSNEVDLLFLDIHMPDFTGFDFIETLKNPPLTILTTSDKNFAIEAFEYDSIVDYLVKPVMLPRFLKAVQRAKSSLEKQEETVENSRVGEAPLAQAPSSNKDLYVNIDRRLIKIKFESIDSIEARGDYIYIKTEDKNYTVHSTLKKIEEKLPDSIFLKIHRSYIINFHKIVDIEDNSVLIKKDVIPISRSNRPELMKRLNLL